jgi:riboflavin kinase/FMN adenylyltransferase
MFHEPGAPVVLEAYLLDFSGDLYGQPAAVGFVSHLRDEERFESVDALVEQMARDVEATRAVVSPQPTVT